MLRQHFVSLAVSLVMHPTMKLAMTLAITLVATIALTGCNQDTATDTSNGRSTAESANATSKDFGDYVVHFNAITTDQLQPEVARTYDIARSKNRAMLNISIIRKVDGTIGQSVAGDVEISANNLTGQVKNLTLRRIREGEAIYYIGDVPVADAETLIFNLSVMPEGTTKQFTVRFSRQFFSN